MIDQADGYARPSSCSKLTPLRCTGAACGKSRHDCLLFGAICKSGCDCVNITVHLHRTITLRYSVPRMYWHRTRLARSVLLVGWAQKASLSTRPSHTAAAQVCCGRYSTSAGAAQTMSRCAL